MMLLYTIFILFCLHSFTVCQLVVNVKNKGGDVEREKIEANTTADSIILEFLSLDGTLVTQFIDFKSDVQIFRIYVPWEEERSVMQSKPQVLCFVTRFGKNEFISSDAMSKLRQKNPTAVRTPEEDRGLEKRMLDLQVNLPLSHVVSPVISNMCQSAGDSTYAAESDVNILSQALGKDLLSMMSAMKKIDPSKYTRCKDTTDLKQSCLCQYQLCIGWYPCGLKYCRGRDSVGKVVNYRCGIKTCKRCLLFEHYARQKMFCLWDDL